LDKMIEQKTKIRLETIILGLAFIEIICFGLFFSLFIVPVNGGVGTPNATVHTNMTVAKVAPEVLNVTVNGGASVTLVANDTVAVLCTGIVRDWDNESDIMNVTARFYNTTYWDSDDNNTHYTNNSCYLNTSYSDEYLTNATCIFRVQYYANPGLWNCTMVITDNTSQTGNNTGNTTISELVALGVPDFIAYGTVNSTYVSAEQIANVTNFGNVQIDLNLEGYARTSGDNFSMNCSRGTVGNISIMYEKYNLTTTTAGELSLTQFNNTYINLTSAAVLNQFNLNYRFNDSVNEAINQTYWRMYAPLGVAGTCEGHIVFGAAKG
jgi:hypothetical protein